MTNAAARVQLTEAQLSGMESRIMAMQSRPSVSGEDCLYALMVCRDLIAEVRWLRECIMPVYIMGKERHKDTEGQLINPWDFVNSRPK